MSNTVGAAEGRILVVAPTAKDARISQALFAQAGLACAVCTELRTFGAELERGIGVVVLTEEALAPERYQFLAAALATQPTWSDLPIILLAGTSTGQFVSSPQVQALGNVLVLERPIGMQMLLSIVQMALRTRRRQYVARLVAEAGQILGGSLSDATTLTRLTALLVPRLADCCILYTVEAGMVRVAALTVVEAELPPVQQARVQASNGTADPRGQNDVQAVVRQGAAAATAGGELVETHLQLLGVSARLVLPLQVHGRLLGMLSLGMLTAKRTFGPEDARAAGEVAARVALQLDQVRLHNAEQGARAEAEAAVQARDGLVALISHDLKNPLTAVLGHAGLLQHQLSKDPLDRDRIRRGLTNIEQAARQIQAQLAELLDTTRRRAGQPLTLQREATDLVVVARAAIAGIQPTTERHQISLRTRFPSLIVSIDPLHMKRVLDNLLSNAVKYSSAGTVKLTINVETAEAERWAVVRVEDNGIGIPPADLPHIFDRFRRAANATDIANGEGLGLASVQQITEQHGGHVTVTSEVDKGSTFTIYLPLTTTLKSKT